MLRGPTCCGIEFGDPDEYEFHRDVYHPAPEDDGDAE